MLEVPGEWKQLKGHLNRGFAAGREEGYKPMTASSLVPGFMPFDHGEEVKNFNGFLFRNFRQGRGGDSCQGGSCNVVGDRICVKGTLAWEFSGTWCFHYCGSHWIPSWGTKIPQAMGCSQKETKPA